MIVEPIAGRSVPTFSPRLLVQHGQRKHDTIDGRSAISEQPDDRPWQQRLLDNIWILLALSVVVPGLLYLGWGLWELSELPTWSGP